MMTMLASSKRIMSFKVILLLQVYPAGDKDHEY